MGSFIMQYYLLEYSKNIKAAILSGSSAPDVLASTRDPTKPTDLSSLSAPFVTADGSNTGYEWLSRDQAEVDKYVADPNCGFGLDADATSQMHSGASKLGDPQVLRQIRPDLPIYIFSGDMDPVGGPGGSLLELTRKRYAENGVKKVDLKLYKEGRHEMLNETNRDEVHADLLKWIHSVL